MNRRAVWILSFGHFSNDFMVGVLGAILPLLTVHFHLTYTEVGVLMMTSNVASSLVQPLFGYVSDKTGSPWLLPFSALCLGIGLVWMGFAPTFLWLLPAVVVSGIGSAAFHPDGSRAVYFAAAGQRGLAQSIFQVGGNSGLAVSALSLWFLGQVGMHGTTWFMVLAVLSALGMGALVPWFGEMLSDHRSNRDAQKLETAFAGSSGSSSSADGLSTKGSSANTSSSKGRGSLASGRSASPSSARGGLTLLFVIVTIRSWIAGGITTFVPLYVVHFFAVATKDVWLYTFVFLLFGAFGTLFGGPLADRIGQRSTIRLSMWCSTPLTILLPFLPKGLLLVDLALIGFFLLSTFAVTVVYGQEMLPGNIAMVSGLLIGFAGGVAGVGTILVGHLADAFSLHATLQGVVWVMPVAALCSLWLPLDKTRQKVVIEVPGTSGVMPG